MNRFRVKRLVWRMRHDGLALDAAGFGVNTFYRIVGEQGNWSLISPAAVKYQEIDGFLTQHDAKQAAQSDYEARVQSALVTDAAEGNQ